MEFESHDELMKAIQTDVYHGVANVGERILGEVVDNIMEIVYKPHDDSSEFPARVYTVASHKKRVFEGGFIGSWILYDNVNNKIVCKPRDLFQEPERFYNDKNYNNNIEFIIMSEPNLMVLSHPSHEALTVEQDIFMSALGPSENSYVIDNQGDSDRRDRMPEIIAEGTDYDYKARPIYGPEDNWWTRERDYFTPSLTFADYSFSSIVQKSFSKKGIEWSF